MKKLLLISAVTVAVIGGAFALCNSCLTANANPTHNQIVASAEQSTVVLDVQNMTCATCPYNVRKSLERVEGVSDVKVSFDDKTATVIYDPAKIKDAKTLAEAATNTGYPSTVHQCTNETETC